MNRGSHLKLPASVDGDNPGELDASLERFMDELHAMTNGVDHLDCSVGATTAVTGPLWRILGAARASSGHPVLANRSTRATLQV